MYQLDFVCIDFADEQLLDAQLRKMIVTHMLAGDFDFAPAISYLTTALFRFRLPGTQSAIAMNFATKNTLTNSQLEMLRTSVESPTDVACLNSIMSNIIQALLRHDVATWKLALYRLEQVSNLTYTLDKVNDSLKYDLFDPVKIADFRQLITDRKSQVCKFIEEEKQKS